MFSVPEKVRPGVGRKKKGSPFVTRNSRPLISPQNRRFPTPPPSISRTTQASTVGTARDNNRTQAAAPMGEKPVQIPASRNHSTTFSKEAKGVHRGEPPMRALWLLSLAREKVTPPAGAHPCPLPQRTGAHSGAQKGPAPCKGQAPKERGGCLSGPTWK